MVKLQLPAHIEKILSGIPGRAGVYIVIAMVGHYNTHILRRVENEISTHFETVFSTVVPALGNFKSSFLCVVGKIQNGICHTGNPSSSIEIKSRAGCVYRNTVYGWHHIIVGPWTLIKNYIRNIRYIFRGSRTVRKFPRFGV